MRIALSEAAEPLPPAQTDSRPGALSWHDAEPSSVRFSLAPARKRSSTGSSIDASTRLAAPSARQHKADGETVLYMEPEAADARGTDASGLSHQDHARVKTHLEGASVKLSMKERISAGLALVGIDKCKITFWPQRPSIVDPRKLADAAESMEGQAFIKKAHWYGHSQQAAAELAIFAERPARMAVAHTLNLYSGIVILLVFGAEWYLRGASPLQYVTPLIGAAANTLTYIGLNLYGAVSWSHSGFGQSTHLVGALGVLYTLLVGVFSPAQQIPFGSRFVRVAFVTIYGFNAQSWANFVLPRHDGGEQKLTVKRNVLILGMLCSIRYADGLTDFEVADFYLKQVASPACTDDAAMAHTCDLILRLAIVNIIAGLLDLTACIILMLVRKFLNRDKRSHRIFHGSLHLFALVMQCFIIIVNVYYTVAIEHHFADKAAVSGFKNRATKMTFFIFSLILTCVSAYLSIADSSDLLQMLWRRFRCLRTAVAPSSFSQSRMKRTSEVVINSRH